MGIRLGGEARPPRIPTFSVSPPVGAIKAAAVAVHHSHDGPPRTFGLHLQLWTRRTLQGYLSSYRSIAHSYVRYLGCGKQQTFGLVLQQPKLWLSITMCPGLSHSVHMIRPKSANAYVTLHRRRLGVRPVVRYRIISARFNFTKLSVISELRPSIYS